MCFWLFSFGVFGSGSVPGASFGFRQGCWLCFMRRMLGFMEALLSATNNVTVYALVKVCFLNEDFVVKEVFFLFLLYCGCYREAMRLSYTGTHSGCKQLGITLIK